MKKIETLLLREAANALLAWSREPAKVQSDALTLSRELPLWLRRHGLLATLAHLINDGDERQHRPVAESFIDALHKVAPIAEGGAARARVAHLATESLTEYLLHCRMALALADAWVRLAEPLLTQAGPTTTALESAETLEDANAES